eukprot:gene6089-1089_t
MAAEKEHDPDWEVTPAPGSGPGRTPCACGGSPLPHSCCLTLLSRHHHVTALDLFQGGVVLGPLGCEALSNGLTENWSITYLQLRRCNIGPEGMEVLSSALRLNRFIKRLGLARNRLGDGGCVVLMQALRDNAVLEELDLEFNEIKDEGLVGAGTCVTRACPPTCAWTCVV